MSSSLLYDNSNLNALHDSVGKVLHTAIMSICMHGLICTYYKGDPEEYRDRTTEVFKCRSIYVCMELHQYLSGTDRGACFWSGISHDGCTLYTAIRKFPQPSDTAGLLRPLLGNSDDSKSELCKADFNQSCILDACGLALSCLLLSLRRLIMISP
jgi:hypothetical protein